MPPARTEKTNSHADAPAPAAEPPMRRLLKPVTRGIKDAEFRSSEHDWDNNYHRLIGTTTKTVSFGSQFVLTDYDAKNDAKQVTNHGIILLSKSLPNLKVLELPGTKLITDDGLIGLFQNCSQMKNLEVSGGSYSGGPIEGNALDELRAHPEWVPGLKSLKLVDNESNKVFMTAMKEMSKARPALAISLVSRSEEKNYGDWDLEVSSKHFKNGRKSSAKPRGDRFMSQDFGLYGGGGRYGSFYGRY
ncbi:hypothetical protein FAVG1_11727 [Fusarium avenaceum]|nr:hypothetical protein FAVG1_11727 [Fusarium avenaceum]